MEADAENPLVATASNNYESLDVKPRDDESLESQGGGDTAAQEDTDEKVDLTRL